MVLFRPLLSHQPGVPEERSNFSWHGHHFDVCLERAIDCAYVPARIGASVSNGTDSSCCQKGEPDSRKVEDILTDRIPPCPPLTAHSNEIFVIGGAIPRLHMVSNASHMTRLSDEVSLGLAVGNCEGKQLLYSAAGRRGRVDLFDLSPSSRVVPSPSSSFQDRFLAKLGNLPITAVLKGSLVAPTCPTFGKRTLTGQLTPVPADETGCDLGRASCRDDNIKDIPKVFPVKVPRWMRSFDVADAICLSGISVNSGNRRVAIADTEKNRVTIHAADGELLGELTGGDHSKTGEDNFEIENQSLSDCERTPDGREESAGKNGIAVSASAISSTRAQTIPGPNRTEREHSQPTKGLFCRPRFVEWSGDGQCLYVTDDCGVVKLILADKCGVVKRVLCESSISASMEWRMCIQNAGPVTELGNSVYVTTNRETENKTCRMEEANGSVGALDCGVVNTGDDSCHTLARKGTGKSYFFDPKSSELKDLTERSELGKRSLGVADDKPGVAMEGFGVVSGGFGTGKCMFRTGKCELNGMKANESDRGPTVFVLNRKDGQIVRKVVTPGGRLVRVCLAGKDFNDVVAVTSASIC